MSGRLRQVLQFQSDADLKLDVLLLKNGAPVDLTGCGVQVDFYSSRAAVGFSLTVGHGILTPVTDGRAKVRVAAPGLAARIAVYDNCQVRVTPPDGEVQSWIIFRATVYQAASGLIAGSPSLNTGQAGAAAPVTVTADWDDTDTITVDAAPGVAGLSYRETLISLGDLPSTANDRDLANEVLRQLGLIVMPSKFFAIEEISLPSDDSVHHSAWQSVGVTAGNLCAQNNANAMVTADQPIEAWLEFSDANDNTGVIALEAANVIKNAGATPLSAPVVAEYFRVALKNPMGGSPATANVKTSFNG